MCVCPRVFLGRARSRERQSLQSGYQLSRVHPTGKINEGSDHLAPALQRTAESEAREAPVERTREREARTQRVPAQPLGAAVTFREGSGETRTRLAALAAAPSSAQPPLALPPALQPRPGTARTWPSPSSGGAPLSLSSKAPPWRGRRAPPRARPSVPVRPACLRAPAGDDGEAELGSVPPAPRPALLTAPKPVTRWRRLRHKAQGWGRPGAEATSRGRCKHRRHESLCRLPDAPEVAARPPGPPCARGVTQVRADPEPGQSRSRPSTEPAAREAGTGGLRRLPEARQPRPCGPRLERSGRPAGGTDPSPGEPRR